MLCRYKEGVYTNPALEYKNPDIIDEELQSNYYDMMMAAYGGNIPSNSNYFIPDGDESKEIIYPSTSGYLPMNGENEEIYPSTSGYGDYIDPRKDEGATAPELEGVTSVNADTRLDRYVNMGETVPSDTTVKDLSKKQTKYHFSCRPTNTQHGSGQ